MQSRAVVVAMLVVLASAAGAGATRVPAFTTVPETNCQRAVSDAATKTVEAALIDWVSCYNDEGHGRGDCAGINVKETGTYRARVITVCQGLPTFTKLGLGASVPAAADAVIAAALARAQQAADSVYARSYGSSNNANLANADPGLFSCLGTLSTEMKRLSRVVARDDTACLDADDSQQVADPSLLPACDEAQRDADVSAEAVASVGSIAAGCTTAQLVTATGKSSANPVAQNLVTPVEQALCSAYPNAGNLSVCGGLAIRTLGGSLSLGWRGGGNHGQAVPASLADRVDLRVCTGSGSTTCQLRSLATGTVRSVTPAANPDRACLVTTLTGDLSGNITFTGNVSAVQSLSLSLPQKIDIYLPVPLPAQPCPTCSGAALGSAGVCGGGANDGQPCVVDGAYGPLGNTSTSCLPISGAKIGSITPDIAAASTGPHSLASTFHCTGAGAGGVFCPCSGQLYPNSCDDFVCAANETCADDASTLCLPDPIVRNGSTSPITVSGAGCATTPVPALQTIIGLPGPIAVDFDLDVTLVP